MFPALPDCGSYFSALCEFDFLFSVDSTWYFMVLLISLSVMPSRFIHVVTNDRASTFSKAEPYYIHYTKYPVSVFVHPLMGT